MRRLTVCLLSLLLLGCAGTPIDKQWDWSDGVHVTFKPTWRDNLAKFCGGDPNVYGCTTIQSERRCTIRAVEPSFLEDDKAMAGLGHELLHCFYGGYHP